MPTIRLTLAYDGTDFAGWQVQPDARTVQGEVESAIQRLTGEQLRVLSAGRTDAGVHALGQVASFRTESSIPAEKFRPALQSKLPADIVVLSSAAAPDDFHATYAAKSKRYRYVIYHSLLDSPFLRRYAWRIGGALNIAAMESAARALLGTHDFRCFETDWPNKATSVRTVRDVSIRRVPGWSPWGTSPLASPTATAAPIDVTQHANGSLADDALPTADSDFLCFEIAADGFLYNMVRAVTGTLVNIGRGKWPVDSLAQIIASQNRARAGETAPPQGLYLVSVDYDDSVS